MSLAVSPSSISLVASDGQWVPVAGLKITRWRHSRDLVDVSLSGEEGWRRLLPEAGSQAFEIEGTGVCIDPLATRRLQQLAFSGGSTNFRIMLQPALTIESEFLFGWFEGQSKVDEEGTFAFLLSSSGPVSLVGEIA